MTAFVLRRVLWTLPVLLVVVTTIFFSGGPLPGHLLTGSFVIELICSVPGISRYCIASVSARD